MYKSASTSRFQNTSLKDNKLYGYQKMSSLIKSPCQSKKGKKLGVQFKIEDDKENLNRQFFKYQPEKYQNEEKPVKQWNQYSMTSKKQINQQNDLFQDLSGKINYKNQKFNAKRSNFFETAQKKYPFQETPFSNDYKTQRTMQKSKSMKSLSQFGEDKQFLQQQKLQRKRSQRKFHNLTKFDGLLKQTQNLIEKYKKLDDQKTKLKSDLQNQIEFKSKSSKRINLLQEQQAQKKYQKPQRTDYLENYTSGQKYTDYSSFRKTFSTFQREKTSDSEIRFQNKSKFRLENQQDYSQNFYLKKQLSSTKNLHISKQDSNSCSYNGSFGLYKSSPTKKLSPTGLSLQDFQLGKILGSGAFGQVFPALHKKTGWIFALKKIKKASVKHMLDQFIEEIKIQLFLDNPNIVKLYSFFDDDLHFYILMEYMQGGSLYSYLKKKKTLTIEQTSQKLRQVCEGLQHMHENSVIHRDIKPQNIVLSHNVSKLCDFGWSAICKGRRTTYCGTLDYVCPQIIEGEDYDDSVDIWSLGVLAYELLVGKTPFYNISRKQTMKKIIDCNLEFPSNIPKNSSQLYFQHIEEKSLTKDPLLRISQNQSLSI